MPDVLLAASTKTATLPDVSIGSLLGHTVLALVVIVGGLWGVQKIWAKNKQRGTRVARGGGRTTSGIQIVARHSLGKDQHLAVVLWGDREVLVGISGQTITFLEDGDRPAVPTEAGPEGTAVHRAVRSAFEATRQVAQSHVAPTGSASVLERLRDLTARS